MSDEQRHPLTYRSANLVAAILGTFGGANDRLPQDELTNFAIDAGFNATTFRNTVGELITFGALIRHRPYRLAPAILELTLLGSDYWHRCNTGDTIDVTIPRLELGTSGKWRWGKPLDNDTPDATTNDTPPTLDTPTPPAPRRPATPLPPPPTPAP